MIGNIYPLKGDIDLAVITQSGVDSSMFYCVPIDQCPLAGTWDVDSEHGVLRCAYGVWVHKLDLGTGVGGLPLGIVTEAQLRIVAMVFGNPVKSKRYVDDDIAYLDHMRSVARVVAEFECGNFLEI